MPQRFTLAAMHLVDTSTLVEFIAACVTVKMMQSAFSSFRPDWREHKLNEFAEADLALAKAELDRRVPPRVH